eukprot:820148-Amphidinium_carterae.1
MMSRGAGNTAKTPNKKISPPNAAGRKNKFPNVLRTVIAEVCHKVTEKIPMSNSAVAACGKNHVGTGKNRPISPPIQCAEEGRPKRQGALSCNPFGSRSQLEQREKGALKNFHGVAN